MKIGWVARENSEEMMMNKGRIDEITIVITYVGRAVGSRHQLDVADATKYLGSVEVMRKAAETLAKQIDKHNDQVKKDLQIDEL